MENNPAHQSAFGNDIKRRSLVKGAAWSVPVLATAVAAPMASASGDYDVRLAAVCAGNYDVNDLETAIGTGLGVLGASLAPTVVGLVEQVLNTVGLTEYESRGFTINSDEGTIPAMTQFTLATDSGLIDLSFLQPLIDSNVLSLVTTGASSTTFAIVNPIAQGSSLSLTIPQSYVDLGVTGTASLALVGNDDPTNTASEGADTASLSLVSVDVNLGNLVADTGLGGLFDGVSVALGLLGINLGTVLSNINLTVQLCPGQTDPTAP